MARLVLSIACLFFLILGSFADREYEEHGHDHHHHHHHHDHDGHDHHDHESHKKLFAGGDFGGNEEEQREKLRVIASKIDADQDGKISRDEMLKYTAQRIKEQQDREADDFINSLDPKGTNKISFEAYVRENFGDLDVKELEKASKTDTQSRETRRTYLSDKQKWTHLDKDADQSLNYEDFRQFLRPENDDQLRRIEIDSIIKEYDDNNDGKISKDEYLKLTEAETGQSDDLGPELDTNNDGYGDFDEFARYYLPASSVTTDEETDHLLKECDSDKNGYCTPEEIVNAYTSFAGSQITDFGADLETAKEDL